MSKWQQKLNEKNGIQLEYAVLPEPIPDQSEYNRLKAYHADHQWPMCIMTVSTRGRIMLRLKISICGHLNYKNIVMYK